MANDDSTLLAARLERWQRRAAVGCADNDKAEKPRQLFLPGFNIDAMPNHLNHSSLFAPIARGEHYLYNDEVLVTRRDCVLEYSGEQLDEADADLVMALIYFAQPQPLGEPVELNRKALLRRIRAYP